MAEERFKNRYLISSARANWHEYDGGEYFITICTQNKKHYFGEIKNEMMKLSEIGLYTEKCITEIPLHNSLVEIPLYVIMPNHIHLVAIVHNDFGKSYAGDNENGVNVKDDIDISMPRGAKRNGKNIVMQNIANQQSILSTAIGGMKRAVTCFANKNQLHFGWQTRFHDHIIRDTDEMNRIAGYIENNIARWEYDIFYD
ncbi:MAG: transposase [Bacteroidales bacterium]|nr:transposase [Bacteroidales bacterium]